MRLFEFEAKNVLKKYGIQVPQGEVATTADEVAVAARKIGKPVVLKSQVLVAGRGKAGGIVFADTASQAREIASRLIGSSIRDSVVRSLLVEEKLDIARQFYGSITVDRQARSYIVLASTEGGVDIEQVAETSPEKIARQPIDFDAGFSQAQALKMIAPFGLSQEDSARFGTILSTLYETLLENDAELVELNPLVKTGSGEFVAADARMIIDDNALFRHPELGDKNLVRVDDTPLEAEARKQNLAYVELDGDIGIVGNGAGLVMATLDMVSHFGGHPANFLDVGGGGNVDITKRGILLVMSKPSVKAVLVNILGGITRCDVVAQAVIEALNEAKAKRPVVVRMIGTNEKEGIEMLRQVGITTYPNMEKAVEAVLGL